MKYIQWPLFWLLHVSLWIVSGCLWKGHDPSVRKEAYSRTAGKIVTCSYCSRCDSFVAELPQTHTDSRG